VNWSYKKLKMYRSCPMSVKLKYIDHAPEPVADPKYEAKRLRGIEAHAILQQCINEALPVPAQFENVAEVVEAYRALGARAEEEWFFDNKWQFQAGGTWKDSWLQVKQDVVIEQPEFVLTADWKTGKKYGNEVDHFEQMRLYSVAAWIKYPGRQKYTCELQYIDQDETWSFDFTPQMLEKAVGEFDRDVEVMSNDTVFRPHPNIHTCKYCPFSPRGSGACPVGVA
jgi:hypothetical protein